MMISKLILITGFVFSSFVFADGSCENNKKSIDNMSITELRTVKKGLNEKLEDYKFEYHYTITHNRIFAKTVNFHIERKIDSKREDKILFAKKKLSNAMTEINEKTFLIYDTKKQIINYHIKEIDKRIRLKLKREFSDRH